MRLRCFDEHVLNRLSGGDHGEYIIGFLALTVDEARPFVVVERSVDDAFDVARATKIEAFDSIRFRQLNKVGVAFEIHTVSAVFVEQFLPLTNHAEVVVVQNNNLDRQLMDRSCRQLKQRHLKTAVSTETDNQIVGTPKLRADGSGQTETHRARSAGAEEVIRVVRLIELSSPHLMLSDIGDNNSFAFGEFIKLVDDMLHFQVALPFEFEREFLFPAVELFEPVGGVQFANVRHEFVDDIKCIADAVDIGLNHFSDFGRVDIDMNNLRLFAEFCGVAQNSVVEARTNIDEQVALANGLIGISTPVHPEPTER